MTLRRYANTDEQEEALALVEEWSKTTGWYLNFGTSIGISPQTIVLDHNHQDNCIYVYSDGTIFTHGDEEISSLEEFAEKVACPDRTGIINQNIYSLPNGIASEEDIKGMLWREKGTQVKWDPEEEAWLDEEGNHIPEEYITEE